MAIKISPSILAADYGKLEQEVTDLTIAGMNTLHLDIMDGSFVPEISFGAGVVEKLRLLTDVPFDVHLMVDNPGKHIKRFFEVGADLITIHQEASTHLHKDLQSIKELGIKAGVAINPGTPNSVLPPIFELADLILIMSVNPGWGGQKFINFSLSKLNALKPYARRHSFELQVDGGVNNKNIRDIVKAGATNIVCGSYITKSTDYKETIKHLRNQAAKRF